MRSSALSAIHGCGRANDERQVTRLEGKLANLTRQAARGGDIDVRRAQVEVPKAKLSAPAEIRLDRETLKVELTVIRQFKGGVRLIDDTSKDHIVLETEPVVGPLGDRQGPGRRASSVAQGRRSADDQPRHWLARRMTA